MDWTLIIIAAITGIPATIGAVGALIVSLKNLARIDNNTQITKDGTEAAAHSARAAAAAAVKSNAVVQDISNKLNGGVDSAILTAIEPLKKDLKEHAASDEKNIAEIKTMLKEALDGISAMKGGN